MATVEAAHRRSTHYQSTPANAQAPDTRRNYKCQTERRTRDMRLGISWALLGALTECPGEDDIVA